MAKYAHLFEHESDKSKVNNMLSAHSKHILGILNTDFATLVYRTVYESTGRAVTVPYCNRTIL